MAALERPYTAGAAVPHVSDSTIASQKRPAFAPYGFLSKDLRSFNARGERRETVEPTTRGASEKYQAGRYKSSDAAIYSAGGAGTAGSPERLAEAMTTSFRHSSMKGSTQVSACLSWHGEEEGMGGMVPSLPHHRRPASAATSAGFHSRPSSRKHVLQQQSGGVASSLQWPEEDSVVFSSAGSSSPRAEGGGRHASSYAPFATTASAAFTGGSPVRQSGISQGLVLARTVLTADVPSLTGSSSASTAGGGILGAKKPSLQASRQAVVAAAAAALAEGSKNSTHKFNGFLWKSGDTVV